MIITKEQMLSGEVSRAKYYTQFVTVGHMKATKNYKISGENKTPFEVYEKTPLGSVAVSLKAAGQDACCKAFKVCLLKQATRLNQHAMIEGLRDYVEAYIEIDNIPEEELMYITTKTFLSLIKNNDINKWTTFYNLNINIDDLNKIINKIIHS